MFKVEGLYHQRTGTENLDVEFFTFPGGELHFKIDDVYHYDGFEAIQITTDLHNSDEIMKMMLIADFLLLRKWIIDSCDRPHDLPRLALFL